MSTVTSSRPAEPINPADAMTPAESVTPAEATVPSEATTPSANTGSPAISAAPAPRPLRRNAPFQALWLGSAASTLGLAVADIAYPLAILAVTGSPGDAGLFAALQALGALLAGLPGGLLVDRVSPRAVLMITEGCRALVTAVVAAGLAMGWLSFPWLLAAAVLLGIGQPVTSAARMLLVRSVVPAEQLTSALTQDELRINGAALAGPPIGGGLAALRALAHAVPFVFTAGSFVLSLASALLIRPAPAERPGPPGSEPGARHTDAPETSGSAGGPSQSMLLGIRVIWANPMLRAATLLIAVINTVGVGLDLVAVVLLRAQGVPPGIIGLSLAGAAAGGLAGTRLVRPLHRLQPGVLLLAVCLALIPLCTLLALPYGPWWTAGLLFVAMLGVPALRVLADILILRPTPAEQRGRVVGAVMTLFGLGTPVGYAAAGLLLQHLRPTPAMLVLAGALAAGVLYCATKRELWRARWPQEPQRAGGH
jgi:MFS family permease